MRYAYFIHNVSMVIDLTRAELREIVACAEKHPDPEYHSVARHGGPLAGEWWAFSSGEEGKCRLTVPELAHLTRATEHATTDLGKALHAQLRDLTGKAQAEQRRLNELSEQAYEEGA